MSARYTAYKDSGIEWLEEVPAHWAEVRIKDVAFLERGKFTHRPRNDPEMYDGSHPFIQTGDVARANKYVTTYKQTLSDKGTEVSRKFKSGTLLMAIAANIGDVAIVNFDTYFPDSVVGFTPIKSSADYLFYLFTATRSELDRVKVTSTQDNLNLERLNSLVKFYPPLSEQIAIAAYLDTKTAQIDRQIDLLDQKVMQYSKLKQSLINETITRGLDNSVLLKDSKIDWIGDIPEHWEVKRFLDVASLYNGNSLNDDLKEKFSNNSIPCLPYIGTKDIEISTYRANIENGVYIPNCVTGYKCAPVNATLLCIEGASAGKKMTFIPEKVCFVNKLLCIAINSKNNPLYIHYFVRSTYFSSKFNTCLTGLKDNYWGVTGQQIRRFSVPIPPIEEQNKIAEYIDQRNSQIDRIIAIINAQIDQLKDLRKTLINEVVTGKIKVVSEEGQSE